MNRWRIAHAWAVVFLFVGCDLTAPPPAPTGPVPTTRESPVQVEGRAAAPRAETGARISGGTERDLRFAEFVRDTAGSMVEDVSVGVERKGLIQVVLGGATAPEDTLPMTQALVAGARKDFSDRPFTLVVFDPSHEPILKAHSSPDGGVRYEVVGAGRATREATQDPEPAPDQRQQATEKDSKFAAWALKTGHDYLQYVDSNLDRRGLLVFGITEAVQPGEVRDLTRSLLEGARQEFPDRRLTAIVFDPHCERIGQATLDASARSARPSKAHLLP